MRTVCCSGRLGSGVSAWGVCVQTVSTCRCPGGLPRGCTPPPSTLWTEFLTHAYENITFPQLLLTTVINFTYVIPKVTRIYSTFVYL